MVSYVKLMMSLFWETKEEHDANLVKFLSTCKRVGIKLNRDKMQIEVDKITFMGHQVTRNGLEIDPEKVEAIQNMKQPTFVEDVRRFVGIANWQTDHKPLVAICSKPLSKAPKRLQSMLLKVQEYNFEVVFKPGCDIPVADTLSRAPTGKPIYTEVVAVNNI